MAPCAKTRGRATRKDTPGPLRTAKVVNARDDVAETALAHVVGSKTVRAYNRTEHLDERHVLMEQWGLWVLGDQMPFNDMKTINGEIMKRWMGAEKF